MSSVTLKFRIRFLRQNINKLPSLEGKREVGLVLPYVFYQADNPTFFDLWCRCPTMLLTPSGSKTPYVNFDTPLIEMKTCIFDAHDWTEEYMEQRFELKVRMCAKVRQVLQEEKEKAEREVERINARIDSINEYEASLATAEILRDDRFPLLF